MGFEGSCIDVFRRFIGDLVIVIFQFLKLVKSSFHILYSGKFVKRTKQQQREANRIAQLNFIRKKSNNCSWNILKKDLIVWSWAIFIMNYCQWNKNMLFACFCDNFFLTFLFLKMRFFKQNWIFIKEWLL